MRVETYNKRSYPVDMVLYDGSEESAKFINEWSNLAVSFHPQHRRGDLTPAQQ